MAGLTSEWRKSSRSGDNGACVEVRLTDEWRKSNRSGASGDCVEVRRVYSRVEVRDSKDLNGPKLSFPSAEWEAFLAGVKDGNGTP